MHPTLFTLGYEGLTIEAFITRLQTAQVKTVVDVRELPLSRKKGFSKSAFCAALSAHGMAYLHAPALGCPKPIRNQYKVDGNWHRSGELIRRNQRQFRIQFVTMSASHCYPEAGDPQRSLSR